MAEYRITHRPVLSSTFAARTSAVSLAALPEGRVIHVLGKPGGRDMTDTLRELAGPNEHGVRAAGPGQWFIVGDAPMPHADLQALFDRLAPEAFGVDQSHGRVRIRVAGPAVANVLAKGTAVDLDTLAVGQSAMTLIGHISVHMTRTAPDAYELMVLRGFAESLWDDLVRMSAEYA
jgi:sarcosine oxidase subunit gamma